MSEYLNAAELASLQIRGLPGTAKNIIEKAKRESWPSCAAKNCYPATATTMCGCTSMRWRLLWPR